MLDDGKPRNCGFCKQPAILKSDTADKRVYHCAACDAEETITKGQTWWYHGWKANDGRRLRAPTVADMERGLYGWQPDTPNEARGRQ
jgi:hypothetical protein